MTDTNTAERDDFEKVFPLPSGCIRCGTGYASTGYSNWAAHTHCERWQGWQARASLAARAGSEPVAWLYENRLGMKQAFTNEPPPSLKAQCIPLYPHPSPPEGMAGWISVDERLPDETQAYGCETDDCLVLLPNKRKTCAMLVRTTSGPKWLDQESRVIYPTHWMQIAAQAPGRVFVPLEPTDQQINAAVGPYLNWKANAKDTGGPIQSLGAAIYRAMVEAVPPLPASEAKEL